MIKEGSDLLLEIATTYRALITDVGSSTGSQRLADLLRCGEANASLETLFSLPWHESGVLESHLKTLYEIVLYTISTKSLPSTVVRKTLLKVVTELYNQQLTAEKVKERIRMSIILADAKEIAVSRYLMAPGAHE